MMNEENFKKLVAKNLSFYRKANKLTQLELAEKLNYSDKAISKWERGESLPDLYTLNVIAEFFGITINDLCSLTKNDIKAPTLIYNGESQLIVENGSKFEIPEVKEVRNVI